MFIVLHGADEFTSREALARLIADPAYGFGADVSTVAIERFDGALADLQAVRMAAETLPFLTAGRLVLVEGLPKPKRGEADREESAAASAPPAEPPATKGKRGAKKPSAAAQAREFAAGLAELAATIPTTTTLVVLVAEELPKTHPLLVAAAQHGKVVLAAPRTGAALDQWLAARAKAEQARLEPEAARLLIQMTAGNQRLLAMEVAKLATYVGAGGTIDRAVVQRLVPDDREARVFDLTDALARGERARALDLLHALLEHGEAPLMVLAMITRQVRTLIQIQDLASRGARSPEIAQAVGLPPFIVDKTLPAARRSSPAQLAAALRACLEVDTALKRSRMAPELALDLLVTEFGVTRA